MYITRDELSKFMGLTIASNMESFVDSLIEAAQGVVESICGRWFEAPDPDEDETRYYNGNGATKLSIDDLRSFDSLVVDGVTLTEDEDFFLCPNNAEADGVPYEWIELIQPQTRLTGRANSRIDVTSPYIFEEKQRNVEVTGKFGYSDTPPETIKVAVMKVCAAWIKENIGDSNVREIKSENLGEYAVTFQSLKDMAGFMGLDKTLDGFVRNRIPVVSGIIQAS